MKFVMKTKPKKSERNAGAVALACCGLSQERIAARLGMKDRTAVAHWKSGKFRPRKAMREKIHAEFGIDPKLWDLAPEPKPKARKGASRIPGTDELRAPKQSTLAALMKSIEVTVDYLEANRDEPAIDRVNAILMASRALLHAHRLSGAQTEVTMRAVLNSQHWRAIERVMRDTLAEKWPDALAAIDAVITKLYAEDTESVFWNSPVREFGLDGAPLLPPQPLSRPQPQPAPRRSRRGRSRDPFAGANQ
ncbi:MAG: hypothetical protein R3B89_17070 [Polyangiaceae bacterium]